MSRKVQEPTNEEVWSIVAESNGTDWCVFLESGQLGYKPRLMIHIDFGPCTPNGAKNVCRLGLLKYGCRIVDEVILEFSEAKFGKISIAVGGEFSKILEGVKSFETEEPEDLEALL